MRTTVKKFGVWVMLALYVTASITTNVAAVAPATTNMPTRLGPASFLKSNTRFYSPATGAGIGYTSPPASPDIGIVNHILISSNHGKATVIRVGIYYDSSIAGKQYIDIMQNYKDCRGFPMSSVKAIDFRVFTPQEAKDELNPATPFPKPTGTSVKAVVSKNVCDTPGPFYSNNVEIDTGPKGAGSPFYDPDTNMKVVTLDIKMTPEILAVFDAGDPTENHIVTFSLRAASGGGYINTKDAVQDRANNSIVGRDDNDKPGNILAAYPFGIPCSEGTRVADLATSSNKVVLYDADNLDLKDFPDSNQEGYKVRFYIEKATYNPVSKTWSWSKLRKNDYNLGAGTGNLTPEPLGAGANPEMRFRPDDGNGNVKAYTTINQLQSNTHYRMIVTDLRKQLKYGNNYIYAGLPGDGIYGNQDFKCPPPYGLDPTVGVSTTLAEPDQPISVLPQIQNTTDVNASIHAWKLYTYSFAPGQPVTASQLTATAPMNSTGTICGTPTYNQSTAGSCSIIVSTSNDFPARAIQPGAAGAVPYTIPSGALPGTRYCFVSSVQAPDPANSGKWKYSPPICVLVGIKPKLQVLGGDARVDGDIKTSQSKTGTALHGSWGEYGVFADGQNKFMASGNGFMNAAPTAVASQWSSLTFANTTAPFGFFAGIAPPAYNPGAFTNPGGTTIGTTSYGSGAKAVLRFNGTLRITGNLTYADGPYTDISQIPNIKIIADDIIIDDPAVTRIDPWLIARRNDGSFGSISTCSSVPGNFVDFGTVQLDSTMCKSQLRFNAPVIANALYPYRTFGNSNGDPAETFNLNASNLLSSFAGPGGGGPVATTQLVTDLPPRF